MLLILIMNKNVPLHPNSSYYQMYISIIQKSYIIIINIIMRQTKPVSWFEISLRACRNEDIFFLYLDIYFVLRKMNGLVSTTFSLEQKSGFKFEINKDLTFIVIIIDIDWYKKITVINYRDQFLGHIAQPTLNHFVITFRGIVHPKTKMLSGITQQTCKTFVHLWNTKKDIFDEIRELSDPAQTPTQLTCSRPRKVVRTLFK